MKKRDPASRFLWMRWPQYWSDCNAGSLGGKPSPWGEGPHYWAGRRQHTHRFIHGGKLANEKWVSLVVANFPHMKMQESIRSLWGLNTWLFTLILTLCVIVCHWPFTEEWRSNNSRKVRSKWTTHLFSVEIILFKIIF